MNIVPLGEVKAKFNAYVKKAQEWQAGDYYAQYQG